MPKYNWSDAEGAEKVRAEAAPASSFPDFTGSGSPEGVITADVGKTYQDNATAPQRGGGWLKSFGTGNTGWVAVGALFDGNSGQPGGAYYGGADAEYIVERPHLSDGVEPLAHFTSPITFTHAWYGHASDSYDVQPVGTNYRLMDYPSGQPLTNSYYPPDPLSFQVRWAACGTLR